MTEDEGEKEGLDTKLRCFSFPFFFKRSKIPDVTERRRVVVILCSFVLLGLATVFSFLYQIMCKLLCVIVSLSLVVKFVLLFLLLVPEASGSN